MSNSNIEITAEAVLNFSSIDCLQAPGDIIVRFGFFFNFPD